MTKRPSIPPLRSKATSHREEIITAAIVISAILIGVGVGILGYRSTQQRSTGWEHISGDLYRRADCVTGYFIYREPGSFGNVEIETVKMSEEQVERFCSGEEE